MLIIIVCEKLYEKLIKKYLYQFCHILYRQDTPMNQQNIMFASARSSRAVQKEKNHFRTTMLQSYLALTAAGMCGHGIINRARVHVCCFSPISHPNAPQRYRHTSYVMMNL